MLFLARGMKIHFICSHCKIVLLTTTPGKKFAINRFARSFARQAINLFRPICLLLNNDKRPRLLTHVRQEVGDHIWLRRHFFKFRSKCNVLILKQDNITSVTLASSLNLCPTGLFLRLFLLARQFALRIFLVAHCLKFLLMFTFSLHEICFRLRLGNLLLRTRQIGLFLSRPPHVKAN